MSGQVQFSGTVPFTDRRTNTRVEVRVYGVFVGQGIEPHEEQPIREWIINALATSALAYEGEIQALPSIAGEWGAYVSQQLSPQLAQYFNAHGQLHIQGVELANAAAKSAAAQPVAAAAPVQKGAPGGSVLEQAAAALSARLGVPIDQARQAAAIVLEVAGVGGGAPAASKDAYAKDAQAHGKAAAPHDPYAKGAAPHDPFAKAPHHPHAKGAPPQDPYAKGAPPQDPYGKGSEWKK